ncbi:hypothetical protein STEG23_021625, partial [Scotinomys teguina]
ESNAMAETRPELFAYWNIPVPDTKAIVSKPLNQNSPEQVLELVVMDPNVEVYAEINSFLSSPTCFLVMVLRHSNGNSH